MSSSREGAPSSHSNTARPRVFARGEETANEMQDITIVLQQRASILLNLLHYYSPGPSNGVAKGFTAEAGLGRLEGR